MRRRRDLSIYQPKSAPTRLPVWNDSGRVLQVNEIFYSIEGEGLRVGEPTTFVRLARCNLRCPFCDTEFDRFHADGRRGHCPPR